MRHFNRLLGFLAVSFVLAFMGKVNKTGLYTAYFKTLADVEIRNSQSFDLADTDLIAALPAKAQAPKLIVPVPDAATFDESKWSNPFSEMVSVAPPAARSQVASMALRCMSCIVPRAPSA